MIKLLRKITLIFLTFQREKKRLINCSNGLGLYTWIMKLEILSLMLVNLELMLNACCLKKFTVRVLARS